MVASILFLNIFISSISADDSTKKQNEPKKESSDKKAIDISVEGTLSKHGENYILKTTESYSIKLVPDLGKDAKINLEDWVNKSVKVSGKGFVYKYEKGGKTVEKKDFESIKEITLVETAEKKPEEKK